MKEENATSWEEFETILHRKEGVRQKAHEQSAVRVSDLLYRGQADSLWRLETTLERSVSKPVSLYDYYRLIERAKARIETFTDKSWKIPTFEEYLKWLQTDPGTPSLYDTYEYFIYLRHHGFPSPLLDWTASPYVAAFFAMDKPARDVLKCLRLRFLGIYWWGKTYRAWQTCNLWIRPERKEPPASLSSTKPIYDLHSYGWRKQNVRKA